MHECPDCGEACYCHGDLDDIYMAGEEQFCGHYRECQHEQEDEDEDVGEEDNSANP